MKSKYLAATAAALMMSYASASLASVTTYTSESDWIAAVGTYDNEPFDASGLQSFTDVVSTNGSIGPARANLSGSVWNDVMRSGASTTFSYLPAALIGSGGTWDTAPEGEGSGLTLTLNLVGGGTEAVGSISSIDGTFFGFVSTDAFSSFTIGPAGGQETYDLDNLHFASAAPEPASIAVLGFGLLALGRLRRRRAD